MVKLHISFQETSYMSYAMLNLGLGRHLPLPFTQMNIPNPQSRPSLLVLNSLPVPLSPLCLDNLLKGTLCMFQNSQFTPNDPIR